MDIKILEEEKIALEILEAINLYNTKVNGFSLEFNPDILNELNFEIVDDFDSKNVLIAFVLKYSKLNLDKIHLHLMYLGIKKSFIDKSSFNSYQYLTVWIPE